LSLSSDIEENRRRTTMRHVTIHKSVTDLVRMEFNSQLVASFYVGENGIERVEYGENEIPRTVAVFDPAEADAERVTLDSNPLRWAELLPTAYRSGEYIVSVVETKDASDSPAITSAITAEMQAVPN